MTDRPKIEFTTVPLSPPDPLRLGHRPAPPHCPVPPEGGVMLPVIYPTLPGKTSGVISLDPPRVQCQECGIIGEHPWSLMLAVRQCGLRFHRGWVGRLCRECRMVRSVAEGCGCTRCREDRTGSYYR